MPKKIPWEKIETTNVEDFLSNKSEMVVRKNHKVRCSLFNIDNHVMTVKRISCGLSKCHNAGECKYEFKVQICSLKLNSELYSINSHLSPYSEVYFIWIYWVMYGRKL